METLFKKALGDTPKIRVLEFLIEGRELDYAISDIAEGAEIGRTTLYVIFVIYKCSYFGTLLFHMNSKVFYNINCLIYYGIKRGYYEKISQEID